PSAEAASAPPAAAPPVTTAGGAEVNPSGDIPDNQAFVPYSPPGARFTVSVPEGWSRLIQDGGVAFTDKLNSVRIAAGPQPQAPTVESVRAQELPALRASVPGYQEGTLGTVSRSAGPAILITYGAISDPDPVTGRSRPNDVQRYEFWHTGQGVTLTLSGPKGADNVDPWRKVTDSLRWTP
ncbi:MAG: hypothetical protein QOD04_5573, partial [Pseudonocardiales bacterium]|nr:hypothetical protein [Pseudonocardiales bacterium]